MTAEWELYRGPQDGVKVNTGPTQPPEVIYVGREWLGDGHAAWARKPSKRFCVAYTRAGCGYWHTGYRDNPEEVAA